MAASVIELQAGTGDEIPHGAGHEHLSGACDRRDARRDMDGDANDIIALDLDLTSMEPATHLDAQRAHPLDDCRSATHSTGGTIKGREKSIAQSLDLPPAKPSQLLADRLVVAVQQHAPAS